MVLITTLMVLEHIEAWGKQSKQKPTQRKVGNTEALPNNKMQKKKHVHFPLE